MQDMSQDQIYPLTRQLIFCIIANSGKYAFGKHICNECIQRVGIIIEHTAFARTAGVINQHTLMQVIVLPRYEVLFS